ncbi:MAG: diguanylate cyclase [Clostridia bacterium]|nr:diguanylate cyclase [Clostridia bacterium]
MSFEVAVTGSNDGVWDWDLKSDTISFCNRWKEMLGFKGTALVCKPEEWIKRIYSFDVPQFKTSLQNHLSGKCAHFLCEYRIKLRNGRFRWLFLRGTLIRDNRKRPVRICGLQTDITDRKKYEDSLQNTLEELRFALASEKILMDELDRKNRELTQLSITDGLTGLFNHRFLQERFDFEMKRVSRYGGKLSCMLIDIDHFKNINDVYGHQFGDHVLRQIAQVLKSNSRDVDICGRYGGEEFLIISNLCADDALKFATKLHTVIEENEFHLQKKNIKVTVSIGIAEYQSDIKNKQELIERADTAMYQAKKDGRNLIRLWKEHNCNDEKILDKRGIRELTLKFEELSKKMHRTYVESTNALIRAVDAKDPYAKEHSKNVAKYSFLIAKALKLNDVDIDIIRNAALLHDIGKISIRNEILTKKGPLTQSEMDILKKHPQIGVEILRELKFLEKELPLILHHHERIDGSGYPHGLRGREIPIGSKIIAVADAFDSMICGRTYKRKLTRKKAVQELIAGKNKQFSSEIVDVFLTVLGINYQKN